MSALNNIFTVAAVGGSGPKATAISFMKNEEGIRPWAWMSNTDAMDIVPGMVVRFERVTGLGSVQTSYTKDGVETALKVPKVQVFWDGVPVIDAPDEEESLPAGPALVTDAARKYREAYLAKRARDLAPGDGDEVI